MQFAATFFFKVIVTAETWYSVRHSQGVKGDSPNEYSCDLLDNGNGLCWIPDRGKGRHGTSGCYHFWGIAGWWFRVDPRTYVLSPVKAKESTVGTYSAAVLRFTIQADSSFSNQLLASLWGVPRRTEARARAEARL